MSMSYNGDLLQVSQEFCPLPVLVSALCIINGFFLIYLLLILFIVFGAGLGPSSEREGSP